MITVKTAADEMGVTTTTMRRWGTELADFLSTHANPPKGGARSYSDEDIVILRTVAVLRSQRQPFDEIRTRIAAGERLEPVPQEPPDTPESPTEGADSDEGDGSMALAPADLLERFMIQLESANEARVDAEIRAASAETRAEMLQAQLDELKAGKVDEKRGWWDRLRGR